MAKKSSKTPPLRETLVTPDPNDPDATTLELDELWSFVLKKINKVWIWIALCRKTRQVVARAIGDRSDKTCCELWNNIPEEYRKGHCFSDFWDAYQKVIPEDQLTSRTGSSHEGSEQIERKIVVFPNLGVKTFYLKVRKNRERAVASADLSSWVLS